MDQSTQELLESLAGESCASLFEAYGVALTPLDNPPPLGEAVSMTGVIGFTGPGISGMCLLAAANEPLTASNPAQDGSLRDWMAELVNQLAGRVKHKLIARGATVYITTPIVLQGARIEPLPRRELKSHQFEAMGGRVSLWVEVETTPDFVLSNEPEEEVAAEGEAMMF